MWPRPSEDHQSTDYVITYSLTHRCPDWLTCICGTGLQKILSPLLALPKLTNLNLSGNKPLRQEGGSHLAILLSRAPALLELDVGNAMLGDDGIKLICDAISERRTNPRLTSISLYSNNIGRLGVQVLANMLRCNRTLKTLDLYDNPGIGDEGSKELARELTPRHNSSLTSLNLGSTLLGDIGTVAIAASLQHNKHLRRLDLSFNCVGDVGTRALAAALREFNSSLTSLDISECRVSTAGSRELVRALSTNRSLLSLGMEYNPMVDGKGESDVRAALETATSVAAQELAQRDAHQHASKKAMAMNKGVHMYRRDLWSQAEAGISYPYDPYPLKY